MQKWVSVWGNAVSIAENRPERYAKDITLRYPILLPIWYTCAFIVQSGFFGAANVAVLRKKYCDSISLIHYVLQFIPVLDVLGTVILLKKTKKINAASAEQIESATE